MTTKELKDWKREIRTAATVAASDAETHEYLKGIRERMKLAGTRPLAVIVKGYE